MSLPSRIASALAVAVALALGSGCGEDPATPPADGWVDVVLPDLGSAGFMALASQGSRVVAIGAGGSSSSPQPIAVQTTGGRWQSLPLPADPADALYVGTAFDGSGRLVLVGARAAGQPLVLDEGAGWRASTLPVAGTLNAVAAGSGDATIAVGTAAGGLAAWRSAPGDWITDRAGFTTPQEKGLVDITHAGGVSIACGWDDATLQPVLRRHDVAGWQELPGPGEVTIPEVHREHRAVWLEPGGALWVGGSTVNNTGASGVYTASLARRPPSGDWVEIVLPEAAHLEAVNDILVASDGDVYLACGEKAAHVLRWDGAQWQDEGPGSQGQVLALAEGPNGVIYAAGVLLDATQEPQPFLRARLE